MRYFKKVIGEYCYLSPINVADAEKYTEWLNDLEITKNLILSDRQINVQKEEEILNDMIKNGVPIEKMELADRWIYSRLNEVIRTVTEQMENLRMNDVASLLMDFIWKEFCSWYLELSKDRIYNESDKEGQLVAKYILLDVFQTSMRLLQPFMPFISEEIWQGIREHFHPRGNLHC